MTDITGFPTREKLRDLKRREIVRCASLRFGAEGYENVRLDDIAAELGVTKAALYNYISSKSDLLMQCYDAGMERLVTSVEAAMAGNRSAAERLNAGLQAYILTMTERDMQYLWSYTPPHVTTGHKRGELASRDKLDSLVRETLRAGVEDGSLRSDLDPKMASFVILGAVNWVGIWYRDEGSLKRADIARDVTREALRGYIRPDGADPAL
ncbi:TetR/AcrR family transcriptional regulator [Rhodalgimonas zhirmunskyi]|uniref:TetR/AcrR family transcriptional regulator n=1 Tax=Rhodalgimonas zhirmunskyi TaxID=2964767 RepID=A0AAJ1X7H7_9RHOB|nr:TetR/AcrR family transcriptional regulator [Rhodoalgimonas zhirmunskyi]MDQ2094537.1 TetR/AcrR family transcriptional regulator [Rhodoalgimonas zhirmunskyi]